MTNINTNTTHSFGSRIGHGIDKLIHVTTTGAHKAKEQVTKVLDERKKAKEEAEKKELTELSQAVYDRIKDEIEVEIPEETIKNISTQVFKDITDIVDRRINTRIREIVELTVEKMRTHKK